MRSVALLTSSFWLLLFISSCHKNEPCTTCPPGGPDTTSHSFNFTQYTFGGSGGSSNFNDVAILADTLVIAVGEVYLTDSTGQVDDQPYSIAKWNGTAWSLERLYDLQNNLIPNVRGVLALSASDIWLADGGVYHWNGVSPQVDKSFDRISLIGGVENGQSINRVWGLSSKDIFGVGYGGMVAHYDGFTWTKLESGTTIDLRDVWGSSDGSVVWASGWSNDEGTSVLLGYDGKSWKTVWRRDGSASVSPFGTFVTSEWGDSPVYFATGRAVFRVGQQDTVSVASLPWFPYRIRGSAGNNIALAGDEGMIWHFNGATWKDLNEHAGQPLYSIAVSQNLIVAVGVETAIGFGAALIYMGRRQ